MALTVKGDALYNLGNFEHALLSYQRAIKLATTKDREGLAARIARSELAITNAVGPTASQYFKQLDRFLRQMPANIMGMPWFKLRMVVAKESNEAKRQSRVNHAIKLLFYVS